MHDNPLTTRFGDLTRSGENGRVECRLHHGEAGGFRITGDKGEGVVNVVAVDDFRIVENNGCNTW